MARGLGGFLSGFTEGYKTVSDINSRQEQAERDKERFGLEKERLGMEKTAAASRETLTGLQIKEQEGLQKEREKEVAFKDDMQKTITGLRADAEAKFEGELVDSTGKSMGFRRFSDPQLETTALQEKGLMFKPGSVKEVGPMDAMDFQTRFADQFMAVNARHGKLTPESLTAARKQRKELETEGAMDAARYLMTSGDKEGARKMFNKNGKIKIGDDVSLEVIKDPIVGAKIVGFKKGPDGKPVQVFDMFDDVILPSMSPEQYAKTAAEMKKLGITEKGETGRTMLTQKGAMDRTVYESNARSKLESGKAENKDVVGKQLREIMFPLAEKQAGNANMQFDGDGYRQNTLKQLDYARWLYDNGKVGTLEAAAAQAVKEKPYVSPGSR